MTKARVAATILLWAVTVFLALVCLRSGVTKFPADGFWVRDFRRWGYPGWFRVAVGAAELIACALLLVPRLASYGAALFAAVMLGAIYTHAAHGEQVRLPFNVALFALSVVVLYARRPNFLKKRAHAASAPGARQRAQVG